MKKIITLIVIAGVLLTNSCKKEGCMDSEAQNYDAKAKKESDNCEYNANQLAVKKLEGKWRVTEATLNGVKEDPEDFEGVVYLFRDCESRSSGCTGNVTYPDPDKGSISEGFKYSVTNNGKTLNTISDYTEESVEIKELSDKKLVTRQTFDDVDEYVVTYEKF